MNDALNGRCEHRPRGRDPDERRSAIVDLGYAQRHRQIAGCRKRRVRIAPEAQAIFHRRRYQPRRPPLQISHCGAQSKAC